MAGTHSSMLPPAVKSKYGVNSGATRFRNRSPVWTTRSAGK